MQVRTPTLPEVFSALSADVRTTLGWRIRATPERGGDGRLWSVTRSGQTWIPPSPVASLPGWIQHEIIDSLGTAWPRCPKHSSHPLRLTLLLSEGSGLPYGWHCDAERGITYPLGGLAAECGDLLDPYLPPGTVRWYLRGEGWGVIADDGRDLWFNVPAVEPSSLPLTEGDRVLYEIDEQPHDAFPARARRIRKVRATAG